MAISVAVAVGDIAGPLVDALARQARDIRVGPGDDPGSEMGPLVTAAARGRIAGLIGTAEGAGATVVVDGRHLHRERRRRPAVPARRARRNERQAASYSFPTAQ